MRQTGTDAEIAWLPSTGGLCLRRSWKGVVAAGLLMIGLAGCSGPKSQPLVDSFASSLPPGTSVAIAPPINASGSADVDMLKVADLMASELSTIRGVGVIGVNRVLAVLANQGVMQITSADHALAVCDHLGADAIIVFAVTEYNPYTPVVGLVAEIYGRQAESVQMDPVATSRMARPFPVPPDVGAPKPWAQVQKTFNASHDKVQKSVREYADSRDAHKTPFGWRKYLASQENYLRYCCYTVARELVQ